MSLVTNTLVVEESIVAPLATPSTAGLLSPSDKVKLDNFGVDAPVDFSFKGAISVSAGNSFSVSNLGARVIKQEDRYLEVVGSVSVTAGGSIRVNNGSISIRRA